MDRQRRHSDQMPSGPTPVLKVIGFHVEGVAASPLESTMIETHHPSGLNSLVGSPNPVIIPPAFTQIDSPHVRTPTSNQGSEAAGVDIGSQRISQDDVFLEGSYGGTASTLRGGRTTSLPPLGKEDQAALRQIATVTVGRNEDKGPWTPTTSGQQGAPIPDQRSPYLHSASATSSPNMSMSPLPAAFPGRRRESTPHLPRSRPEEATSGEQPSLDAAQEAAGRAAGPQAAGEHTVPRPKSAGGESRRQEDTKEDRSAAALPDGGDGKGKAKAVKTDRGPPPEKKPALTRAERRAKQEAEKAAKASARRMGASKAGRMSARKGLLNGDGKRVRRGQAAGQEQEGKGSVQPTSRAASASASLSRQSSAVDLSGQAAKPVGLPKSASKAKRSPGMKSTELFAHLPQYKAVSLETILKEGEIAYKVHPLVLQLGLKYADGTLKGGNARCIGLLTTFQRVIKDYTIPEGKVLSRDLTAQLNTAIQFLVECRPLSVSMGNAIKFVKMQVSKVDPSMPQDEAKALLIQKLETFVQEKIIFAGDVLVSIAATKVEDGDVILTYGFSTTVYGLILRAALKDKKKFRVLVVDARPHLEGRGLLNKLLQHGIPCTYMLLNAASLKMPAVTKVFLGAAAVMSNGTVMSRVGSAGVAMMASTWEKPVIICCETYKFHERVLLDSITSNELGDPEAVATVESRSDITALKSWDEQTNLGLLNLTYDAMPAEYVTVIVTECGAIPPTSVPVILREYRQEPVL